MNKIQEIEKKIHDFSEERGWIQYHNGKDLALSIVLEASELLECFQWISNEEAYEKNMEHIKEELADVLMYCFRFADEHKLDIEEIMLDKMKKNAIKYPLKNNKSHQ
ncbi:MAG: nucleotide pyrophosphohydrolase [Haloplasmataceae bacterium]|nr:nucleotide pyrophosphohydrolase [Haloplasmataceae bacterium]